MSKHRGPRINAEIDILKRKDLTEEEKAKRIKKLNNGFKKLNRALSR